MASGLKFMISWYRSVLDADEASRCSTLVTCEHKRHAQPSTMMRRDKLTTLDACIRKGEWPEARSGHCPPELLSGVCCQYPLFLGQGMVLPYSMILQDPWLPPLGFLLFPVRHSLSCAAFLPCFMRGEKWLLVFFNNTAFLKDVTGLLWILMVFTTFPKSHIYNCFWDRPLYFGHIKLIWNNAHKIPSRTFV